MKIPTIAEDIARGTEIRAEIAKLKKELDSIEARLEAAAEKGPHEPLEEAEREGKQSKLRGPAGRILPVRFESDQLISSFAVDSPTHTALAAICGGNFGELFKRVDKFERRQSDGHKFRKLARELLAPEPFAQLIHAATSRDKHGIAKSKTVIAWDDITEAAA